MVSRSVKLQSRQGQRWSAARVGARFALVVSVLDLECGGRIAVDEHPTDTMSGAGAVVNPPPDGQASDASNIAPDGQAPDGQAPDASSIALDGSMVVHQGGSSPNLEGGAGTEVCPSACTGGCDGGVCVIAYDTEGSGGLKAIVCPADWPCRISCGGTSACQNSSIICATTGSCEIVCNGLSACQMTRVRCPTSAMCALECDGPAACSGSTMECGSGPCIASCAGPFSQLSVTGCAQSSSCDGGCAGPRPPP